MQNTKKFSSENEAKRANEHGYKIIINWPPFLNEVNTIFDMKVTLSYTFYPVIYLNPENTLPSGGAW